MIIIITMVQTCHVMEPQGEGSCGEESIGEESVAGGGVTGSQELPLPFNHELYEANIRKVSR